VHTLLDSRENVKMKCGASGDRCPIVGGSVRRGKILIKPFIHQLIYIVQIDIMDG